MIKYSIGQGQNVSEVVVCGVEAMERKYAERAGYGVVRKESIAQTEMCGEPNGTWVSRCREGWLPY